MTPDILFLDESLLELNQQQDGSNLQDFGDDTSNALIAKAKLGARVPGPYRRR